MAAAAEVADAAVAGEVSGEAAPALISVHPLEHYISVAVGSDLRVFNLKDDCSVSLSDHSAGLSHSEAIRVISFSTDGALFVSAGDDKLVKIWNTDSWCCMCSVSSEKRVSAAAISHDGKFVSFADKFGVVWLVCLNESSQSAGRKAVPILGHYCSIIACMNFSPDGRFIATADRDNKIRITLFPREPLKGAHDIQTFCLGHTEYVSCLAFLCPSDPQGLLLSGSSDSTIRLWNYISGLLLDTYDVGNVAGLLELGETQDENHCGVSDISATSDASLIAVAIRSFKGVMVLKCDLSAKSLQFVKVIKMRNYIPTCLGIGSSGQHLWTIMGACNLPSLGGCELASRLKVISLPSVNSSETVDEDHAVLQDSQVPGGERLLSALQGTTGAAKQEVVLEFVSAALRVSMNNMMIKKQYSEERREFRKRGRNDKKMKQKNSRT